jgi:hypothetical protein
MPRKPTHGMVGTRLYNIWKGMTKRCRLTTTPSWRHYGGRGVRVCDEWRNDFRNFHSWALANGYADNLTIDRFPNKDGDYEPSNCRWATQADQVRNTRRNRLISNRGRTVTVTELAREHGLAPDTLIKRLNKNMDLERALTTVSRRSASCPEITCSPSP